MTLRTRSSLLAVAFFAALVALAGTAQAAMEPFSFSYGPVGVPEGSSVVGSLPLFDPSLGTLTMVELSLSSTTSSGEIQYQDTSEIPSNVTLGIGATVTVSGPNGLAATATPLQLGSGTVTAEVNPSGTYTGSDAFTVVGNSGSDSGSGSITDGSMPPYIGIGTFNVNSTSTLQTEILSSGGGSSVYATSDGSTSGLVTVTYFYTPVPEPGSVVLLGMGVAGLLWIARRRRTS